VSVATHVLIALQQILMYLRSVKGRRTDVCGDLSLLPTVVIPPDWPMRTPKEALQKAVEAKHRAPPPAATLSITPRGASVDGTSLRRA
jgi:hypothetical protein